MTNNIKFNKYSSTGEEKRVIWEKHNRSVVIALKKFHSWHLPLISLKFFKLIKIDNAIENEIIIQEATQEIRLSFIRLKYILSNKYALCETTKKHMNR